MKNSSDIQVMVQARMSSQRVPGKMLRPFANTTLMDICAKKLWASYIPNEKVYFSLYDDELIEWASGYGSSGFNIFFRSEQSAKSEGTPLSEIYEWCNMPARYTILISACNPLLSVNTINSFYQAYLEQPQDGLFGVFEKKTYYWDSQGNPITKLTNGEAIMNTKTVEPVYEAAHCLYAGRNDLIPQGVWMGTFSRDNPCLFVMPELETFDIDYEWQFRLGEMLYKNRGQLPL